MKKNGAILALQEKREAEAKPTPEPEAEQNTAQQPEQ